MDPNFFSILMIRFFYSLPGSRWELLILFLTISGFLVHRTNRLQNVVGLKEFQRRIFSTQVADSELSTVTLSIARCRPGTGISCRKGCVSASGS
jgi:hypothetical protein